MKISAVFSLLMAAVWVVAGCAGQKGAAIQETAAGRPGIESASAEEPPAAKPSSDLTPEEEALLEDDWAEDDEDLFTVADPLEGFNRAMFVVNDKLYFWVLKPVTRGYRTVMPVEVRTAVANFFTNLGMPIRVVNGLLQAKPRAAGAELVKFMFNSTVGVLGFGDPSRQFAWLNPDPEDLGQTLGSYGLGNGFYIVWPVLGPSTLRDSVGEVGDRFLNPIAYVDPQEASFGLSGYKMVNTLSFRIGDYESLKQAALDPYEAMRDGYIQLRRAKLKK